MRGDVVVSMRLSGSLVAGSTCWSIEGSIPDSADSQFAYSGLKFDIVVSRGTLPAVDSSDMTRPATTSR